MRLAAFTLLAVLPMTYADVTESAFGKLPDGREVKAFTLTNKNGVKAKIITYGAILAELHVPDKAGKMADVVMGFDNLDGYLKGHPYFGSNVGRCANRIAKGEFTLEGLSYTLAKNNGPNHLHGGKEGFDKKLWDGKRVDGENAVAFTYTSPDGEEGYPGKLNVKCTYTLTDNNELKVDYEATTDKTTICNLAHHSYFNLGGHNHGDILKHELQLHASLYTPTDDTLIPTGKLDPVAGTPFDFTKPTAIGARIKEIKADPVGYDLNYMVDKHPGPGLKPVAKVTEPTSGRVMEVSSTEPGIQFYSGNFLDGKNVGKGGAVYKQYGAFCLEAQKFPDAINKTGIAGWEMPILKPGETYKTTTVYKFGV